MAPPMDFSPITQADLLTVTGQLQRRPQHVLGVAARCPSGHPSVVVNHPLRRHRDRLVPFPTLYWLTCPELSRAVSRLEMAGLIRRLDDRLAGDDDLAARLHADHASYVEARWRLLDAADQAAATGAGLAEAFRSRGIGGMRHWRSVKCLHLHLAHHLAAHNTIGALLVDEFGIRVCVA
jgi:hypothetical protein